MLLVCHWQCFPWHGSVSRLVSFFKFAHLVAQLSVPGTASGTGSGSAASASAFKFMVPQAAALNLQLQVERSTATGSADIMIEHFAIKKVHLPVESLKNLKK